MAILCLNTKDFVAIDRHKDTTYEATYRPQALYADEDFMPTMKPSCFREVATNLPIYRRIRTDGFSPSSAAWRLPARAGDVGHVHLITMAGCITSAPDR
jgi:hypothetical protein